MEPTPKDTYTIQYNDNTSESGTIPGAAIYGYKNEFWDGGDSGITSMVVNPRATTVVEGRYFLVGDQDYQTYFAVKKESTGNTYYAFKGWGDKSGAVHDPGDSVTASSELAENSVITLTAQWEEIDPLGDTTLENYVDQLPITVFGSDRNVSDPVLITQWTDTDENKQDGRYTGGQVTLDEQGTISYRVSAKIDSGLTSVSDEDHMSYGENFVTFTFHVNVDNKLKFAELDADNKVTLTFKSAILKPTGVTLGKDSKATITGNADHSYSITFDPESVPTDSNGNLDIQITTKWVSGIHDSSELSDPICLTGLKFNLKAGVENRDAFEVRTSANITGTMDMKNKIPANFRAYYRTANGLLLGSEEWQAAFGGTNSNPTALIHALQFMDYKLASIDLANDPMIGQLNANTVTATYPGTVTVTPADITIYMGGDGGYDAVVGEGGGTTTSNSLPHPLFKIEAPDGIDPEDLTFTNGDKTWTVVSDGNGYYHFSEGQGQDKVRVTYCYRDQSGETHTVTNDNFDPTTVGDMYATLIIDLYPGENDMSQVRAVADNGVHYVTSKSGTLTIRAVEDQDATSEIQDAAPAESVAAGSAVAVEPEGGTTYTLNDTGVELPEDSKPSLLFDSIIEDEGSTARTDALEDKVDEKLGEVGSNTTRFYEIKYLDLVDANNGNAWITSSKGTDIYWGYPEGTDTNTTFKLIHFNGLHRDDVEGSSGFDVTDISNLDPKNIEIIDVETTENGIKFHVDAAGFSPFALVWETTSSGGGGATTHTITATAGTGGSISPSGEVSVRDGASQAFAITPDEGNKVRDVVVDGASVGALGSYSFEDVREDHTISVTFTRGNAPADPDDTGVSDWFETGDHDAFLHGYDDGTGRFGPEDSMTRGEAAQMFYNMLKDKSRGGVQFGFEDLSEDAWYYEAVATLASHGILLGTSPTTVEPERPITRAEFTAMAMRFSRGDLSGENIFTDVSEGDWYYGVVVGSIKYGWISGYDDGTGRFGPNDDITRAQATIIANRMLGRVPDGVFIAAHLDEIRRFPDVGEGFYAFRDIVEATNSHDYSKDGGFEHWSALR